MNITQIMSSVSSPIHRYSADIETLLYDQNFTADISNKMRVPTKILVTGGELNGDRYRSNDVIKSVDADGMTLHRSMPPEAEIHDKVNTMQVPDRIILAGHEQHVGVKAPPNELRLERMMSLQPSVIRVETPPRVLTLEDHFFPTVDENSDSENDELQNRPSNQTTTAGAAAAAVETSSRDKLLAANTSPHGVVRYYSEGEGELVAAGTSTDSNENVATLRRQMIKLNRRVVRLENDSVTRQQREMLVYSLGVAYFVLKTFLWLHRHW